MLGQHEAKINLILEGQEKMAQDIGEIKTMLAEKRGERRVALWGIGALSSSVTMLAGYIGKVLLHAK